MVVTIAEIFFARDFACVLSTAGTMHVSHLVSECKRIASCSSCAWSRLLNQSVRRPIDDVSECSACHDGHLFLFEKRSNY
jgi:hypothetical protein